MPTGCRRGEHFAVELRQELDDPGVADQPATLRLTMQLPDERVDVDSEPAGKRCLRVMPQLQKT
jgi:hypothetical protein